MEMTNEIGHYLIAFSPGALAQMAVLAGGIGWILAVAIWSANDGDGDGHA